MTDRAGAAPGSVVAQDWGWRHASRRAWAVRHLDLRLAPGERVLLLGASGAGKSTLLAALAGVLGDAGEGQSEGVLTVGGRAPTEAIGQAGYLMQDPASQIVALRVGDDVAFGCENLGVPADQIWDRVRAALAAVGLAVGLDHPTNQLSGGQQQRLVLAGALAMGADLLALDEPTANLDPAGVIQVRQAVAEAVADRARTLIVVEHHCAVWSDLMDRVVVLSPHGVIADGPPGQVFADRGRELAEMGVWVPSEEVVPRRVEGRAKGTVRFVTPAGGPDPPYRPTAVTPVDHRPTPDGDPVLRATDLSIGYGDQVVRAGLTLAIPRGVSTVITGPNGSGKSTLAWTLAGLLAPLAGSVQADPGLAPPGRPHPHTWRSTQLLTRIGTVFQAPEHQFVTSTVADEIAVGLRALKLDRAAIERRVERLLETLGLSHLAKANPFSLSGGEKRRLSVAGVLACDPAVIILDEPTFGQDRRTWAHLVDLIAGLRDQGTTMVAVSHDPGYLAALGDHIIDLGPSDGD
jgi:energy-coupling factor transport system ATP-binding protein